MKWISVKEQPPRHNTDVLCYLEDGTMVVGYMHDIHCWYININKDRCEEMDIDNEPIYWMPRPKSPITECRDEL